MGQTTCNGEDHQRSTDNVKMSTPITACCLQSKAQGSDFDKSFNGDISEVSQHVEEVEIKQKWGGIRSDDPQIQFKSVQFPKTLRYSDVTVIDGQRVSRRINHTVTAVPFQVAILATTRKLKEAFFSVGRKLYRTYSQGEKSTQWNLHRNGYYVRLNAHKQVALMTQRSFYEGQLVQGADGEILPTGKGQLLTESGLYVGNFRSGMADGEGVFRQTMTKTRFEGSWVQGRMTKGNISSKNIKFEGEFDCGLANGPGQLHYKKQKANYRGQFKMGVYEDTNGRYETKGYLYEGSFKYGKKHGQGQLLQNSPDFTSPSTTYRLPGAFIGTWQEDYFLGDDPDHFTLVETQNYKEQEEIRNTQMARIKKQQQEQLMLKSVPAYKPQFLFMSVERESTPSESGSSQEF